MYVSLSPGTTNLASSFSAGMKSPPLTIFRTSVRWSSSPTHPTIPTSIFLPGCVSLNRLASGQRYSSTKPKSLSSDLTTFSPNLPSKFKMTFASRVGVRWGRKASTKGDIGNSNDSRAVHCERFNGSSSSGMSAR